LIRQVLLGHGFFISSLKALFRLYRFKTAAGNRRWGFSVFSPFERFIRKAPPAEELSYPYEE